MRQYATTGVTDPRLKQRFPRPVPIARWKAQRPKERDLAEQNCSIIDAFASGRLILRAFGEHFCVHYSRVSRIVGASERARRKT